MLSTDSHICLSLLCAYVSLFAGVFCYIWIRQLRSLRPAHIQLRRFKVMPGMRCKLQVLSFRGKEHGNKVWTQGLQQLRSSLGFLANDPLPFCHVKASAWSERNDSLTQAKHPVHTTGSVGCISSQLTYLTITLGSKRAPDEKEIIAASCGKLPSRSCKQ